MPPDSDQRSGAPPVPDALRLAWLLFMQPLKLHRMFRAWRLEGDPSLIKLWPRLKTGEPTARALVRSATLLLLAGACTVTLTAATALDIVGLRPEARTIALGGSIIAAAGLALEATFGVAAGVAFGLTAIAALGVALSMRPLALTGVAPDATWPLGALRFPPEWGLAAGVMLGVVVGTSRAVARGVTLGFLRGAALGAISAVAFGVTGGAGFFLAIFRLPLWPVEALFTLGLASATRLQSSSVARLSWLLPFRNHDLVYLPLPGLRSFLIQLGDDAPELARDLLAEAAASLGQKRPARLALVELQARELERAAAGRLFARAAELDFPFLPSPETLPADSLLRAFQSAARDLSAGGTNHHQRRLALSRAQATITDFRTVTALARRTDALQRRLLHTARFWLDVIQDEHQLLTQEERANPQVPTAFVAGPALTPDRPEEQSLFKGRQDIIQLIEHDLAPERRGALLLFGQRRMGKTSLRNFLPRVLGTGTIIVTADFQALSGYEHRDAPHRRVLELIAPKLPGAPPLPDAARWGEALRWLQWVDAALGNQRLLVVIDEVERVEDGIREGWCSTDFLDFVRAAGDSLRRVRFLLLTAYPLHRLGAHWVDKLVSATTRTISYLDEAAAEELVRRPVPDFPDIYPEGGVERILLETRRHPFLVQKVCDELCRLLNERGGRRRATDGELTEVFDRVLDQIDLFDELWRQRTPAERDALRRLAKAPGPAEVDPVTRQLAREGYVDKEGDQVDIAVPLFRAWIAETQGPAEAPPSASPG